MNNIAIIPVLNDNYAFIITDPFSGTSAIVDPGQARPVINYCYEHDISPSLILCTHHHGDHIGGNDEIRDEFNCKIIAPAAELERIPNIDITVKEGDEILIGELAGQIIETPGHTSGHIAFYFETLRALFCGDTLFSMGCGRVFEGTMAQMYDSVQKLAALPGDTMVYCGHEYTLSNAEFSLAVAKDDEAILKRAQDIRNLRKQNLPTIPTSMKMERETNLFLRAANAEAFARLRTLKDSF